MPFFNIVCKDCGHEYEWYQRKIGSTELIQNCPECGSKEVEKKIGNVNVHYKGSGFYTNDYGWKSDQKKKMEYLASDD